jgi:hypothetical protein
VSEFPLSGPYIRALIERVNAPHASTTEKGDALENVASYLFLLIPGWIPRRDVSDINQGYENDVVISNLNMAHDLRAELLGRHFLVECKNWDSKVGAPAVSHFLHRMSVTHCKFGVILAKDGISGRERGETAARSLIRRAFHEEGNVCIVLDKSDLESLAKKEITFWSMILRAIEWFRFGEPKQY